MKRGGASCIAWARLKTGAPKLSAVLIFLWLLSFYQEKESDMDLRQAKEPNEVSSAESNEQINYILFLSDSFRSGLLTFIVVKTTISVIMPPNTTEGTRPIILAATPDSKAPNSFDDPIIYYLQKQPFHAYHLG